MDAPKCYPPSNFAFFCTDFMFVLLNIFLSCLRFQFMFLVDEITRFSSWDQLSAWLDGSVCVFYLIWIKLGRRCHFFTLKKQCPKMGL